MLNVSITLAERRLKTGTNRKEETSSDQGCARGNAGPMDKNDCQASRPGVHKRGVLVPHVRRSQTLKGWCYCAMRSFDRVTRRTVARVLKLSHLPQFLHLFVLAPLRVVREQTMRTHGTVGRKISMQAADRHPLFVSRKENSTDATRMVMKKMRTRCWERLTYLPMVPRWPPGHRAESLLVPLLCDDSGNARHWSSARLRLAAGVNQTLRTPIFCGLAVFWGRVTRGLLSRPEHRGHVHGRLGRPDLSDPWLQMWRKVP